MAEDQTAPVGEAPKSETTPTNTNTEANTSTEQAKSVDLHGFTNEQLADMRKFYDANGGYEKVKSKISNPEKPVEKVAEAPTNASEPKDDKTTVRPQTQAPEPAKMPQGAISAQEFLAKQYFKSLAGEEKYANIANGIQNGDYLKEMAAFGIQALNADGSINDQKVRMYLDLKAQTVPAKQTGVEPDASAAPTVSYTEVGDNGITNLDQAYKIIMEQGNPNAAKAEEFIKNAFKK